MAPRRHRPTSSWKRTGRQGVFSWLVEITWRAINEFVFVAILGFLESPKAAIAAILVFSGTAFAIYVRYRPYFHVASYIAAVTFFLLTLILIVSRNRGDNEPALEERKKLDEANANCNFRLFDQVRPFLFNEMEVRVAYATQIFRETNDHQLARKALGDLVEWGAEVKEHRARALENAQKAVMDHIDLAIDLTRDILDIYTGVQSSVCLKILTKKDRGNVDKDRAKADMTGFERDITSLEVETRWRDSRSRKDHERSKGHGNIHKIRENTVTIKVLANQNQQWGNDDLVSLGADYHNTRPNWPDYYNATIGIGVRGHWSVEEMEYVGVLCADTLEGGLNNERCISFLTGVAECLSVMLVRTETLEEALKIVNR
jgi:hypothetical protein